MKKIKKINWYLEAKRCKDEVIKNKLTAYDSLDVNDPKKHEIKKELTGWALSLAVVDTVEQLEDANNIVDNVEEPAETPKTEPDVIPPENTIVEDNTGNLQKKEDTKEVFNLTEESVEEAKDEERLHSIIKTCRNEVKRQEQSRLLHQTFRQKLALDKEIWAIKRIMSLARARIHNDKVVEKRIEDKRNGKVSQIATKRSRFIILYKKGISLSNILLHPEGVKKNDILEVVNDDVIKTCSEFDRNFGVTWTRWKDAKLEKKKG